jgi:hypothetical protein
VNLSLFDCYYRPIKNLGAKIKFAALIYVRSDIYLCIDLTLILDNFKLRVVINYFTL